MKLYAVGLASALALSVGCGESAIESEQVFLDFSTNAVKGGNSTMLRYEDEGKVETSGSVTGLTPGHITSVWLVVFNIASACTAPNCGVEDVVPNSPSKSDVMHGQAGVATPGGTMDFSFSVLEGMKSVEGSTLTPDFGIGFTDTQTSEIHLIVVDHGLPIPGREAGQRTNYTIGANCTGGPMMNFCPFIQYAPHYAVGAMPMGGAH
jgi:hypothetical protein